MPTSLYIENKMGVIKSKTTWSYIEYESEVNMHHMSLGINHDVCVMSVLNLKHITKKRIWGNTYHKIPLSLSELRGPWRTISTDEKFQGLDCAF
jgi:hypothetical protein